MDNKNLRSIYPGFYHTLFKKTNHLIRIDVEIVLGTKFNIYICNCKWIDKVMLICDNIENLNKILDKSWFDTHTRKII